jgi:uncharacterized membrane protein YdbT with pleckstrin-like domain
MGYIEQSLGSDETVLARAWFHWLYYLTAFSTLALCFAAALFMLEHLDHGNAAWLALILAGAGLAICVLILLRIWTTEIGVTNQRLIVKRDLFAGTTEEIELRSIEAINLNRGLLGRLLGYGQIDVQGTGGLSLALPTIASPLAFRKVLQDAIDQTSRPVSPDIGRAPITRQDGPFTLPLQRTLL